MEVRPIEPIDRAELRATIQKWIDAHTDVDDTDGVGLLEDVLWEINAQPTLTPLNEWVSVEDWASHQMADGVKNAERRIAALDIALSALRPISREQVEKVWRGEWMALDECSNEGVYCKRCKKKVYRIEYANEKMRSPFCPACGSPMSDEAVEMVMERLNKLEETKK